MSKRYGIVALVVGLLYLATGVYFLVGAESRLATARTVFHLEPGQFNKMATAMCIALWSSAVFGFASVLTSIGLFRRQEWSRKVWLFLTALLFLTSLIVCLWVRGRWLQILIPFAIAGYSWVDLTKDRSRQEFTGSQQAPGTRR